MSCLLLLSGNFCVAQELTYRHYTNKDGLGSSVVYDVLQDHNGYMWFATSVGVSRFDGNTFRTFRKEDGLPDNEITKLTLDRHNNVWFVSFIGIPSVYHNGSIIQFRDLPGVLNVVDDRLNDSIVMAKIPEHDSSHMLGNYSAAHMPGKWKFDKNLRYANDFSGDTYGWKNLRASSTKKINFYFGLTDDNRCFLSVRSQQKDTTYYFRRARREHNPYVDVRSFYRITSDGKGIVYHGADSLFYADENKVTAIYAMRDPQINIRNFNDLNSLYCENDSTLWLCTRHEGLVMVRNYLRPDRTIHKLFPNTNCTAVIKDHENGYWITTHSDGVYYLPNLDFHCLPGDRKILAKETRCLRVLDDSRLAAGFADGSVLEIDRADKTTRTYLEWSLNNKNVRVLDVWPWNKDSIIVISDRGTFMISHRFVGNRMGRFGASKAGFTTADRQLAIACAAGVLIFNLKTGAERKVFHLRTSSISGIGNKLYWGNAEGVHELEGDSSRPLAKKIPALAQPVTNLQIAPDSSLWVATAQGVVVVKNDSVWTITKSQGLTSNACKHITVDAHSAWVSTDQGISKIEYHWKNGQLVHTVSGITELDGLNSNDVNQTMLAGDLIYTATAKGIGYFPRNYTSTPAPAPLIYINTIRAGDREITNKDTVRMNSRENRLLVSLTGISYKSGPQVSYEYRLKGIADQWTSVTNNTIEITAVPYGEYMLEARAIDRWGRKSVSPRMLFISNPPPLWKTTWFNISSYIFFAMLVGVAFYLYSRNQQKKRENNYKLLKKIQDLEILALRSQINPHFIFNCLSSIQYYIQKADIENSNMYLFKFSLLIRKILRSSSEPTITLHEEIQILELYLELEKLRLGSRMQYRVQLDKELQNNTWYIHSMIIQPYIENAIKHGIAPLQDRQGELNISFKKSEKYIECFIEDNGIGINRSIANKRSSVSDHTSMGAGITESRIYTINALNKNKIGIDVLDRSEFEQPGTGTIVHLRFPILTD